MRERLEIIRMRRSVRKVCTASPVMPTIQGNRDDEVVNALSRLRTKPSTEEKYICLRVGARLEGCAGAVKEGDNLALAFQPFPDVSVVTVAEESLGQDDAQPAIVLQSPYTKLDKENLRIL